MMKRLMSANSKDREFIPAEGHLKTHEMGQYQKDLTARDLPDNQKSRQKINLFNDVLQLPHRCNKRQVLRKSKLEWH